MGQECLNYKWGHTFVFNEIACEVFHFFAEKILLQHIDAVQLQRNNCQTGDISGQNVISSAN